MGRNMRELFEGDSKYLKATDLQGQEVRVTINNGIAVTKVLQARIDSFQ